MVNRRNIRIAASVITVIFLIALVLLIAYSDDISYKVYKQKSYDNTVLHISEVEEAIANENFLEVSRIAYGYNMSLNWNEDTENFRYAVYASNSYADLFSYVMRIAASDSFTYSSYTPTSMADSLRQLFKYSDEGRNRNPEYAHFFDAIEEAAACTLKTWLYILDDVETLKGYSEGQLKVLMEEAYDEASKR
ncbi:MAG: hypothetical protein K6E32_10120 [Lachnospiraceae bacterium]|nr:hypothetical protein [Lachnospiraceae bacterium]